MKFVKLIFVMSFCTSMALAQNYPSTLSYYMHSVEPDIELAFKPLPNDSWTEEEVLEFMKKMAKEEAERLKTGNTEFLVGLSIESYGRVVKELSEKLNITVKDTLPKDGALSYTSHGFPQMGFKKAAKSGQGEYYLKINVDFTHNQSFAISKKMDVQYNSFKPAVVVTIELANNAGKVIGKSNGQAISAHTVVKEKQAIYFGNKIGEGSSYRAGDDYIETELMFLLDKALEDAVSKFKIK